MTTMQGSNEQIEQQLWAYIDGLGTDAERQQTAAQLARGGIWKETYDELTAIHAGIALVEPEHPPLRFTKNVMEAIAAAHPETAPKRYINHNIIRGIAAVFIVCICVAMTYLFTAIDWRMSSHSFTPKISMPKVTWSNIFNPVSVNAIIALNVVLVLVLLDKTLRARRA